MMTLRRTLAALVMAAHLPAAVLAKLAPEWASLPAHHGGSYYGQPVTSRHDLIAFYRRALERHQGGIS